MYTLSKAKSDIDMVAKHATDIAAHMVTVSGDVDAKLTSFKAEILAAIDAKFAELARTIHGDGETGETSAVTDLGAQVSRLTRHGASPEARDFPAPEEHAFFEPDHDDQPRSNYRDHD